MKNFQKKNITTKRALVGIPASQWNSVLGQKAKKIFYMMKISKIKKLCVVTGSRAEYGLLKNLLFLIKKRKKNLDYS